MPLRWIENQKLRKEKHDQPNDLELNDMNPASQWRFDLAQKIAYLYAQNPHVAAVMMGGSTARGHADRFSDVELGIFWHQPPTEANRAVVVEQSGADLIRLYPFIESEQVWCDDFMIGRTDPDRPKSGLLVEVAHHTVVFMEATLNSVLETHNPDELKQNLIAGIVDGIPLAGHDFLSTWKQQAAAYPRELALAVVKRHAQIDHFWRWKMWLERGDNRMMLYQSFSQIQLKLLYILLGINRQYYYGFKWIDVVIARLEVQPENFAERMKRIYHLEPEVGVKVLTELVEETYNLIESHLPEIDVDWYRQVFRYQRPILDQAPRQKT